MHSCIDSSSATFFMYRNAIGVSIWRIVYCKSMCPEISVHFVINPEGRLL